MGHTWQTEPTQLTLWYTHDRLDKHDTYNGLNRKIMSDISRFLTQISEQFKICLENSAPVYLDLNI